MPYNLAVGPMNIYLIFFMCERFKGDVDESWSRRCFWGISLTLLTLVSSSVTNGAMTLCQTIAIGPFIGLGLSSCYFALAIWLWQPFSRKQKVIMSEENSERVTKLKESRRRYRR